MNRNIDLLIGVLVIVFGVFVLFVAKDIRPTGPVVDPIGPRAFPYMIGVFFLLGGARIVFVRLASRARETGTSVASDGEEDEPGVPASAVQAFIVMGAAVLYALAMSVVGYLLATPAFVIGGLWAMKMRSWLTMGLTALTYTLITYVIFAHYMRVALPLGPLANPLRSMGIAP